MGWPLTAGITLIMPFNDGLIFVILSHQDEAARRRFRANTHAADRFIRMSRSRLAISVASIVAADLPSLAACCHAP